MAARTPRAQERRIKHHAWAPVHAWFAPCAPGLEPLLAEELRALEVQDVREVPGGVSFQGKLDRGYAANLWLRTANRVLLRFEEFSARRPEDLFRHARQLPWDVWWPQGAPMRVQLHAEGSWLHDESLVAATLRDAMGHQWQQEGRSGVPDCVSGDVPGAQRLLVRIADNRVQLSLDTSGDHLHRRGYRLDSSRAPMRETLAAGLILLAGYDGTGPLVDPMCGSGTLAIEAALLACDRAPGLLRSFAFERSPAFRETTWRHLKREAQERARPLPLAPLVARDLHPGSLRALKANAERAGVAEAIAVERADFFQSPPPVGSGWVVMNPPYGRRLGEVSDERDLYGRIGAHLRMAYGGWLYAVIVPDARWESALALPVDRRVVLPHGGLKVAVLIGRVPS